MPCRTSSKVMQNPSGCLSMLVLEPLQKLTLILLASGSLQFLRSIPPGKSALQPNHPAHCDHGYVNPEDDEE